MSFKRIRDPLYGFIQVDNDDLKLIDHKLVQRLRWVSQLPLEQLVYPSAKHSRFEHSLGVMHLAGIAAGNLVRNSKKRFKEAARAHEILREHSFKSQRDIFVRCARWAGLLHDVGHAPFSHTLEDACRFFGQADFEYDHEFYGAFLARRILEDLKDMCLRGKCRGISLCRMTMAVRCLWLNISVLGLVKNFSRRKELHVCTSSPIIYLHPVRRIYGKRLLNCSRNTKSECLN